jgi:hypothetical protein
MSVASNELREVRAKVNERVKLIKVMRERMFCNDFAMNNKHDELIHEAVGWTFSLERGYRAKAIKNKCSTLSK